MYILTTDIQIQIFKLQFCWPSKTLSTGWSHCLPVCDPAFAWVLYLLFPGCFNLLLLIHSLSPSHYGNARALKTVPNSGAPPEGSVSLACVHGAVPSFCTPTLISEGLNLLKLGVSQKPLRATFYLYGDKQRSCCTWDVLPRATRGQMQSQASGETGRCSGQGEPGIQARYPAERRDLRQRGAPPRPRPSRPRPQALEFRPPLPPGTESRDPGRAGGGWLRFLCPRGASLARRKPRAVAQPGFPLLLAPADAPASRGRSQSTLPFAPHSPALRRAFHLRAFFARQARGERTGARVLGRALGARCGMESKALLAVVLWFCVETRAASVGKEPTPQKEDGEVGCGRRDGDAERSWRPDLTQTQRAGELEVT